MSLFDQRMPADFWCARVLLRDPRVRRLGLDPTEYQSGRLRRLTASQVAGDHLALARRCRCRPAFLYR